VRNVAAFFFVAGSTPFNTIEPSPDGGKNQILILRRYGMGEDGDAHVQPEQTQGRRAAVAQWGSMPCHCARSR
jgi:hypothetical protein